MASRSRHERHGIRSGEPGTVTIYTDGACSGNPGPGGWGAILIWGGHRKEIYGGEANTTNNRMELMAAISPLKPEKGHAGRSLHRQPVRPQRHYGLDPRLETQRMKTADKKPVKNAELWQRSMVHSPATRSTGTG